MARNLTQICNEAISDLPAHPITDIEDGSKEARECSRHLSGVVSDLIGLHDWAFVRRRVALASVTNDREGEWSYAYALPDEIVSPVKLVRDYSASSVPGIVVTPILYWPTADLGLSIVDYEIANGILYTNLESAILEYSIDALDSNKWPSLFAQAIIRTLASRIYPAVMGATGDLQKHTFLHQMAQRAVNEAIADDLNRHPRQRKSFVPDGAIARQAYGDVAWRR